MWAKLSQSIKSLPNMTLDKVNLKRTYIEKKAPGNIKCIVARDTLLFCPYFSTIFDINSYEIDLKLGVVKIKEV